MSSWLNGTARSFKFCGHPGASLWCWVHRSPLSQASGGCTRSLPPVERGIELAYNERSLLGRGVGTAPGVARGQGGAWRRPRLLRAAGSSRPRLPLPADHGTQPGGRGIGLAHATCSQPPKDVVAGVGGGERGRGTQLQWCHRRGCSHCHTWHRAARAQTRSARRERRLLTHTIR